MKTIIHAFRIHASAAKVFDALTTENGLSGWWSTAVQIDTATGTVHFRFTGDFNPQMKMLERHPGKHVVWKCVGGHANWDENTFSFNLSASGEETDVLFKQEYSRELSDTVYGTYNFNWGYYLNSLKQLCETGHGTPFKAA